MFSEQRCLLNLFMPGARCQTDAEKRVAIAKNQGESGSGQYLEIIVGVRRAKAVIAIMTTKVRQTCWFSDQSPYSVLPVLHGIRSFVQLPQV
jgi:hypothetical protein